MSSSKQKMWVRVIGKKWKWLYVLRKILDPKLKGSECSKRTNKKLYMQNQKLSDIMRKWRMVFDDSEKNPNTCPLLYWSKKGSPIN